MATLHDCGPALTQADMLAFSAHFHGQIPDAFVSHYLRYNGGAPAEEDVEAGKWGLPVHGFNPIKHGALTIEQLAIDIDSIVPEDTAYGAWTPGTFVPFAYDAGGNTVFLSLRDDDAGAVYLYADDGGDIFDISDSFEAFRERLFIDEDA